jgi:ankyrin repeat protein
MAVPLSQTMKTVLKLLGVVAGVTLLIGGGCILWPAPHSAYRSIHEYAQDGDLAGIAADLKLTPGDLDLKNDAGETPLAVAVQHCQLPAVKFLIEHHANLTTRASGGATPLHLAAQEGCADAIVALTTAHADINARDDVGRTPLTRARLWHQDAVIPLLQARGALP